MRNPNFVTVSPKYQIVIPEKIRKSLKIKPGQQLGIFEYGGCIEVVPVMSIEEARGFLKGIDTTVEREEDRLEPG